VISGGLDGTPADTLNAQKPGGSGHKKRLFRNCRDMHALVELSDEMAVAETSFMRNGT
jgi:hypothetical protein